ncbi:hypothetical protein N9Z38_00675 [Mariniblastus sp.]|nr:hypothetical protein [Mariniblastus sp.]
MSNKKDALQQLKLVCVTPEFESSQRRVDCVEICHWIIHAREPSLLSASVQFNWF